MKLPKRIDAEGVGFVGCADGSAELDDAVARAEGATRGAAPECGGCAWDVVGAERGALVEPAVTVAAPELGADG